MSFWAMGGYADFVWPAYGISALGLIGATVWILAAYASAKARVKALEEKNKSAGREKGMKRLVYAVPVLAFALLAFFLFKSLFQAQRIESQTGMSATDVLPSALIDKPAPRVALAAIDGASPAFSSADLAGGHVTVVNFFASWCVPCRMESAQLMALSKIAAAQPGLVLYGVDYEEHQPGAGRDFLNMLGNPFSHIVADTSGSEGIQWGVYGVPETYVVDAKGIVRFKLVGALTQEALTGQLLPAIAKARLAS
jgi:cytochrome c biogenesis protein CcmG/thiol:disulfide interchange protein DsbE